ncbi:hypothetical protein ACIQXF_16815 [Lysinibacillus sp. NPDC097231]
MLSAKVERQQQMCTVRKQSDSNKCVLCESEATATITKTKWIKSIFT